MSTSSKCLAFNNINPHLRDVQLNFREQLDILSEEYEANSLNNDTFLPFNRVVSANIGNPQKLGQKPITFFRQVLSILQYPDLLENEDILLNKLGYKPDVLERARTLLRAVGSLGVYTAINGIPEVRKSIANFLERRDGHTADPEDIYLSSGTSSAMLTLLNTICDKPTTGVLIPLPQHPPYIAMLSLFGAEPVPYYLDKSKNWETDLEAVKGAHEKAKRRGIEVRAIIIINPGNLTSACLSVEDIEAFFDFAVKERLVIIADEVYQANIFKDNFYSFKRVLRDLQLSYPNKYNNVELASLHSVSMGITGEGGQRGGFLELVGFNPAVQFHIYKLISFTNYCPTTAQCLIELMVNPPREGSLSYEQYKKENSDIFANLKKISFSLYGAFKQMEGVECDEPQGSMYIFPTIKLPDRFLQAANIRGQTPDEFYAIRLLKDTGICVMPSFGLNQNKGTLRFRATPLAFNSELVSALEKFHHKFINEFY
ncbi:hypothetical protein EPUL_001554 [Erysiphe pulchra]|uniref:Alanine aminotransferase 1 n=1 Tax=Erysiphe pulchra TaxID=225359 RepID=A0A2S4PTM8_9PEZI|nr:hypothetical protein EPUL_001554 [Erysiphe pulchra]